MRLITSLATYLDAPLEIYCLYTAKIVFHSFHPSLIMKNIRNALFIFTALAICTRAIPMVNISDNAELFLTGVLSVKFDSNIFLNAANEKSDTIWAATPGLDLVFGKGSATTGNLYFKEEIRRY